MPALRPAVALAAAGFALALVALPEPAWAACPPSTERDEEPAVDVVATALDGVADPETGRLLSPARFRVEDVNAESGHRPGDVVEVETAVTTNDGILRFESEGITPRAGERWRIRGDEGADGVIVTSLCDGSERVAADSVRPVAPPRVEPPTREPEGPGDDRALSLGVAGAGAAAIAVVLSRRWA